MASPTNKQEFADYCLRKLGAPVIKVEVSDDQLDDRIDEAMSYYVDFHYNGTEKVYYKYQVTAKDKVNKYITMPENIMGVTNVFDTGLFIGSASNMFSVTYQYALNDMYQITSQELAPFYMARQNMNMLEQLLVGKMFSRFNRNTGLLHIDGNWDRFAVGDFIILEAYGTIDPDDYPLVWQDRWLQRYTCALLKIQWGTNLSKFIGTQMLGGTTFNGDRILTDGEGEKEKLEEEMINTYSIPPYDEIG